MHLRENNRRHLKKKNSQCITMNRFGQEKSGRMEDSITKDIRNLFGLKKENQAIKQRLIRDIRNLFQHEEEDHYKPVRIGNFWSNKYIKYESNSDRKKTLSTEGYLNKIRPNLIKDTINDLKKSDTWKIRLTIAINFTPSKDNNEERVMHSKSDEIEIMINNKADKVIQGLFQSLLSTYQTGCKHQ